MYLPPHFREERPEVLRALMRAHPLATLVTLAGGGLVANHLPLLYDPEPGEFGTLRGHVARANPLWREHPPGAEVLAVFTGPDAYISPSWYPSKDATRKAVPTWNYAAVHAWGPFTVKDDAVWLRQHVEQLTDSQEAGRRHRWRVTDAPDDYIAGMVKAIVGFEIPVRRLQGKWKMSQNRPPEDRAGVVAALREAPGGGTVMERVTEQVAELVAQAIRSKEWT
jgi:transcriptional regulator